VNQLKKKSIIIVNVAILTLGILIGFRLDKKLSQKDENKKKQALFSTYTGNNKLPPLIVRQSRPNVINFVIRQRSGVELFEGDTKSEIESLLGSKNFKFSFQVRGNSLELALEKLNENQRGVHMGMLDASRVVELTNKVPIYAASPSSSQECYSEIQFLANENISHLEDLENKNIGVGAGGSLSLASLTFKQLKDKNITVKKLYIYKNSYVPIKDLSQKKIDVFAERIAVLTNNEVVRGGPFIDRTNLKIIYTTNNKVPCNVIFISKILDPAIKEQLVNKFMDVFSRPDTKNLMMRGMNVESIKTITPESWKPIELLFKDMHKFQLNTFASEIINE
jgi:ABC-type phosphate/phosphonate transport system substrate-binding protein